METLQGNTTEVSKGMTAVGISCSVGDIPWKVAAVAKNVKVLQGKSTSLMMMRIEAGVVFGGKMIAQHGKSGLGQVGASWALKFPPSLAWHKPPLPVSFSREKAAQQEVIRNSI